MPRVVAFVNNKVGQRCLEWLLKHSDVVGVVVHPFKKRKEFSTIELHSLPCPVFNAVDENLTDKIKELKPELGVSAYFGYILKKELINVFPDGIVNLHPAYLPWNKGAHTNVWPIVDGSPAGVTLHYIDEGVDTGDVICRIPVEVHSWDTGKTLYERLEKEAYSLFCDIMPMVLRGYKGATVQKCYGTDGSFHKVKELAKLQDVTDMMNRDWKIADLYDVVRACHSEILNIIRACTFPPYDGAYFYDDDGNKVFIEVTLRRE